MRSGEVALNCPGPTAVKGLEFRACSLPDCSPEVGPRHDSPNIAPMLGSRVKAWGVSGVTIQPPPNVHPPTKNKGANKDYMELHKA